MNKSIASPDLKEGIAPVSLFSLEAKSQVLILVNVSRHPLCTTVSCQGLHSHFLFTFSPIPFFISINQIAVSVWFEELCPLTSVRGSLESSVPLWDLGNLNETALPATFLLQLLALPHCSSRRKPPGPAPPLPGVSSQSEHRLFSRDRSPAGGGGGRAVARIWRATENTAGTDAASSERFLRNLCDPSSCVSQSGRRTGLGCPLLAPPSHRL